MRFFFIMLCLFFLSQYFGLLPAIMIADAGQRARGSYIEMSLRRENKCDRKFGAFILLVRRVFCISIHQQWRQWPSPPLRLLPVLSAACKKNASSAHRSPRRSLVSLLFCFFRGIRFFPSYCFSPMRGKKVFGCETKNKSRQLWLGIVAIFLIGGMGE
jgi:hypothetical protein